MRNRIFPACLSMTVLLGAACSDNPAAAPERLTRAEIGALVQAVVFDATAGFAEATSAGWLQAPATNPFTIAVSEVHPCSSGEVALAGQLVGEYDEASYTVQSDLEATVTHRGCAIPTEGGQWVRITGDPDMALHVGMTMAGPMITRLDVSLAGAFAWARRTGPTRRCSLDVSGAVDASGETLTITGTVCGEQVDERVPLDAA
ncbi:MAG TPA: hypothetical protein VGB24_16875 [Longimicrobium sp.]|jgi:hypothetical protein|uniref:hypothetical protein n=1 Tax=Longimicrobium sp. TaxID=2029185 RepID=UPI002EDB2E8F